MEILIRKPDTIHDDHLSDLGSDVAAKRLSDSRRDSASLEEFLNERHLITADAGAGRSIRHC